MALSPRRYYAFFKFDGDEVALFEERLTAALNFLTKEGESVNCAVDANPYGIIFERGVEALETDMGANLEEDDFSIISRKLRILRMDTAKNKSLAAIYERIGLDDFVAFCEEEGIINWTRALEDYNTELFEQKTKAPWSEAAGDWLAEFLGDGKTHHVNEVKEEAIASGIIDDTDDNTIDRDWNKLKVLASRKGNSAKGVRGWWEE